jgi:FMN phosphatase YigB (HAD superfamily)
MLKTEPEYYKRILEDLDILPSETVSLGDAHLSDIRPAKIVGINTIWVNRINEVKPNKPDQIADFEVKDLYEAVDIINSLR